MKFIFLLNLTLLLFIYFKVSSNLEAKKDDVFNQLLATTGLQFNELTWSKEKLWFKADINWQTLNNLIEKPLVWQTLNIQKHTNQLMIEASICF